MVRAELSEFIFFLQKNNIKKQEKYYLSKDCGY